VVVGVQRGTHTDSEGGSAFYSDLISTKDTRNFTMEHVGPYFLGSDNLRAHIAAVRLSYTGFYIRCRFSPERLQCKVILL